MISQNISNISKIDGDLTGKSTFNNSRHNKSFSLMFTTQNVNDQSVSYEKGLPQYKRCLQEIEQIMDSLHEKHGSKGCIENKSNLSMGQKMKINSKFNVSFYFYHQLQRLVNDLKDQFNVISTFNSRK